MGKGGSDAPDYAAAAAAEGQASRENTQMQTVANRPTQFTPWGSSSWENQPVWDESTGQMVDKWTQYQQLSPELQAALDSQIDIQRGKSDLAGSMISRVGEEVGQPMDWGQFGPMTGVDPLDTMQDPSMWQDQAFEDAYSMATRKLDPQFQQEQEQLEIKLRNQGLRPGDQAWNAEMDSLNMRKTDAYNTAMTGARQASGEEAQRMQGMERTGLGYNQDSLFRQAEFANKLRQQAITEDMTKRGFSLNEINALLTGAQVSNPQFQSFSNAGRADTAPVFQAAVNQGNFDQAQSQGFMSGVSNLASTVAPMMMCDRRKKNIKKIGTLCGFPFYAFQYIWGEWSRGVMADEVPDSCVVQHPSGYSMVDYEALGGCCHG